MRLYTPRYIPNGEEIAIFHMAKGDVTVQLAGKDAPITVGNFIELATKGFYDDTRFHKIVENYIIQGGDPLTKGMGKDEMLDKQFRQVPWHRHSIGTGDPGYRIKGEYITNPNNSHNNGALSMARSERPDTAGCQFFFCIGAHHALDSKYTVFGQTIKGIDVIGKLNAGDLIKSVEILNLNE